MSVQKKCEVCLRTEDDIKKDGGHLLTWEDPESDKKLTACNSCYNYGFFNTEGIIAVLERIRGIEDALSNPVGIARAVLGTPFEDIAPELKAQVDQLMGKSKGDKDGG